MGSRGPLRQPLSIRAEREKRKARKQVEQLAASEPQMPEWMPEATRDDWTRTVARLQEAGVVLEAIDSNSVALFVLSTHEAQEAANLAEKATTDILKLDYMAKFARFSRDALQWAGVIGATPVSRKRMNIKPPRTKDEYSEWRDL